MGFIEIKSLADINSAARLFLQKHRRNRIFAFYGEMGIGKTTFIKALCRELEVLDNVNSPSFAIVNVYKAKKTEHIYHMDFYRIKNVEEAFDFGYEDYFFSDNYCFIEWPEKIRFLLPAETISVVMRKKSDNSRILNFE